MLNQALPARRGLFFLLFKSLGRIVEYSVQQGFVKSEMAAEFIPSTPTQEASEKAFETIWEAADPIFRNTMDGLVVILLCTILYSTAKAVLMLRQICQAMARNSGDALRSSVELFGTVRRSLSHSPVPTDVKKDQTPSSGFTPNSMTTLQETSTAILEEERKESLALSKQAGNAMQPVCCLCGQPGVANSMLESTLCGAKVHMRCKAEHRDRCDLCGTIDVQLDTAAPTLPSSPSTPVALAPTLASIFDGPVDVQLDAAAPTLPSSPSTPVALAPTLAPTSPLQAGNAIQPVCSSCG